ncbi:MAG: 23S rRNA (uracil(1939)-C(5))-methyltransferase RlmD [Planctomycetota bacterium]|nr:MAG: 23S rRNA (uracil(1939)-C(5))-methyltransferase RlmD [Planctomycetota bacterium]
MPSGPASRRNPISTAATDAHSDASASSGPTQPRRTGDRFTATDGMQHPNCTPSGRASGRPCAAHRHTVPMHATSSGSAAPAPPSRPRPGAEIEVEILALDPAGGVLGRAGAERVWLARGRPGARVVARVLRRRRSHLEAAPLRELDAGPDAAAPRCAHVRECGGCSFQDLAYERQLAHLLAATRESLAPLAALGVDPHALLAGIDGARETFGYRNKMDFTFSNRRWVCAGEELGADASFALGLHLAGRHQKVLDIARCEIQFERGNAILAATRELARAAGIAPWDSRAHTGVLRHLVLREARATGQVLAVLVTAPGHAEAIAALGRALVERCPSLTTLVHAESARLANVAVGESERVLHGPGWIDEQLAGLSFRVSARSFFQVNTAQAERLVERVRELAGGVAGAVVYDVCCGAGTLGLAVARDARELWGFELEPAAVEDARANAARNGCAHARFVAGDVRATLAAAALAGVGAPRPGIALVDPPRAGLHPAAVAALVELAPRRIVYVSCNARSAARDLAVLLGGGYALAGAAAVDLFPHTPHVESVYALERSAAS